MKPEKHLLLGVVIGLLVLGAIGCASVPKTSAALDAEAKKFVPEPGKGSIYVRRGGGVGAAVLMPVLLDGRIVGNLAPDTFLLLIVPPGGHVVGTSLAYAEAAGQQKINIEAGNNYFFKVSIRMGMWAGKAHLEQLTEEEGREKVLKSKRAESMVYEF